VEIERGFPQTRRRLPPKIYSRESLGRQSPADEADFVAGGKRSRGMIAVWRVVPLFSFFSAGPAIVSAGRYGVGRHRSPEDATPPPPPSASVRERLDIDRRAVRRKYPDCSRALRFICNFVSKSARYTSCRFLVLRILRDYQIRAFLPFSRSNATRGSRRGGYASRYDAR